MDHKYHCITLISLTVFAFNLLQLTRGQNCSGCANPSQGCVEFDGGSLNGKFLGCYGTFTNGATGLTALCGDGFAFPNVSYAVTLGFTKSMCDEVAIKDIFFFDESGAGAICNSEYGLSFTIGIWGCSGDKNLTFWGDSCSSDDACEDITTLACHGSDTSVGGKVVLDIGSNSDQYNTMALNNASFGGAICIREPS